MNRRSRRITPRMLSLAALCMLSPLVAQGHGDVTPQAVDTHTLPPLNDGWLAENPYKSGDTRKEALRIGTSGYSQNCARCHGIEAVSGGIAPDLRKLGGECADLNDAAKKQGCYVEFEGYYITTVRRGRTRDGRVYMPPFEGVLNQEAMWAIYTYVETRRE